MFGTSDWYNKFYETKESLTLFGDCTEVEKIARIENIGTYFINRLKRVFPEVAENPAYLRNSKGNPLFLLCFASANKTALKIAKYILEK